MSLSRSQQLLVRGIAVTALLATTVYVFVVPCVQDWLAMPPQEGQIAMERISLPNAILIRVMEVFMASWFFVLGSAIGSFLNVVIYRTPLGISLISERSRCPVCLNNIAGKDNVPILGWIRLNGRCRNCDCPISGRYPLIEFVCGLFFLLFFYVELISGGANIPLRPVNTYTGIVWIIFYTKWDLVIYYLFHMSILSTLLTWAMMQFDGYSIPRRSVIVCVLYVVVCSVICSWLQPVPLSFPATVPDPFPTLLSGLWISVVGSFAGMIAGILVNRFSAYLDRPIPAALTSTESPSISSESTLPSRPHLPTELGCLTVCGAAFGWQSVLLLGISTVATNLLIRITSVIPSEELKRKSTGLQIFALCLLLLIFWRSIASL